MSNYSIFSKRMGLAKESVRGTAEAAPDRWLAITPDTELSYLLNLLSDETLRGVAAEFDGAPGQKHGSGPIKFPGRAQQAGEFFQMLIGNPSSAEKASFLVTLGSNDKINFKEDGGAELTATLTAGTYIMGTTSATAATLCKEIKDQLEAAVSSAGTYTVTYSYTTKKVTIAVSGGASAVQILWSTGTNAATSARTLLGFATPAADTSSAASVVSDSTTQYAFAHTFTPGNTTQLPTYTFFFDRGLNVKKYNLGSVSELKFISGPDNFFMFDASAMFKTEADGSIGSPVYTDESQEMGFQHITFKIAGASSTEVKSSTTSLKNGLFAKRTYTQSQDVGDFLSLKHEASGTFIVYFTDVTERDKFLAGTTTTLEIDVDGDTLQGSQKYQVNLLFDRVQYTAFAYGEQDGILAAAVSWGARYDTTNSRLYRVELINTKTAY